MNKKIKLIAITSLFFGLASVSTASTANNQTAEHAQEHQHENSKHNVLNSSIEIVYSSIHILPRNVTLDRFIKKKTVSVDSVILPQLLIYVFLHHIVLFLLCF